VTSNYDLLRLKRFDIYIMHGHLTVVILMSAERLADLNGLKEHIMCTYKI